jgi:hypothetical protein
MSTRDRHAHTVVVRIAAVLIAAIGLLAVMTGPASAHEAYASHGSDYAGVASNHRSWIVRDLECDGNRVTGHFTLSNGIQRSFSDFNGCASGGPGGTFDPATVTRVRVCEANAGCSAWQYH